MTLLATIRFAWKNLWAHRLRAVLTIGGVALGIGAIVFLVSLGFGLEKLVSEQVADFKAFTILDVPSKNLKTGKINQETIDRIQTLPNIASVDPIVDLPGRLRLESQNSTIEIVVVSARASYRELTDLPMQHGRFYTDAGTDFSQPTEAVINSSLAKSLGFEEPEAALDQLALLSLVVPADLRPRDEIEGAIVKEGIKVKIIGVSNETNNALLYLPIGLINYLNVTNRTSLKIKVEDRRHIDTVRQAIENIGFSTEYVGDTVAQISQVFALFRVILGGFGAIALIVAALGTFNTLTISLLERIREVGLLKTLGMKKREIFRVFIIESVTIGAIGGVMGIALGTGLGLLLNQFLIRLAKNAAADPVTIFAVDLRFLLIVGFASLLVGLLTGLYPARRAIRTNPLDVLRYE